MAEKLIYLFAILFVLAAVFGSRSGGGSVHVRGHYRNGTYVRSHTRRRRRRF